MRGLQYPWLAPRAPRSMRRKLMVGKFLSIWKGTRYADGQMTPQSGVDCFRLLAAFGGFLEGRGEEVKTMRLPRDTAFHQRETALAAIRDLLEKFPRWERVHHPEFLSCGDLLVTGPPGVTSHGMIAGFKANTAIHAAPHGVSVTSLAMDPSESQIHHVYRLPLDGASPSV